MSLTPEQIEKLTGKRPGQSSPKRILWVSFIVALPVFFFFLLWLFHSFPRGREDAPLSQKGAFTTGSPARDLSPTQSPADPALAPRTDAGAKQAPGSGIAASLKEALKSATPSEDEKAGAVQAAREAALRSKEEAFRRAQADLRGVARGDTAD